MILIVNSNQIVYYIDVINANSSQQVYRFSKSVDT